MKVTRSMLKKALRNATQCTAQHTGWPCGTCFFNFPVKHDFTNQDWQALLLFRGDYKREELDNLPQDIDQTIEKIYKIAIAEA